MASVNWTDAEALRYIASYPDLIRAFGANAAAGRNHFNATGQAEGRVVSFDPLRYTASYSDLTVAFRGDAEAATRHYIAAGFNEGRVATFDAIRYTASYGDLINAFGTDTTAATRHFLTDGFSEGRSSTFDGLRYTASYGDLINAFGTDTAAATRHFVVDGFREGRSANFDALRYTATYGDLINAFGTDKAAATSHYVVAGFQEGRSASFDSVAYLLSNSDLGNAGLNATTALNHWIVDGFREGRSGDALYGREQASHALAVGQTVNGALETATDRDWYQLDLVAGQGVRLEWTRPATGGFFFGAMTVVSDDGVTSQLGAQTVSSNSDLTGFVAPRTGTYYVSIALPTPNTPYTGAYTLSATAFATAQTAGSDFLAGTDGADTLMGGAGGDWLFGRGGNDTYVLASGQFATIVERAGEGIDTVQTSDQAQLGNHIENLQLTGSGNINGDGNSLANVMIGNSGNNILDGRSGSDSIDGGAGADQMIGGLGDDLYVVDNAGDTVVENVGEGTDTVNSSITLTLAANVENLTLTGSADINATGNALNNILVGNGGRNLLDGGTGIDTMIGGSGDDDYFLDSTSDLIVELADGGFDQATITGSFTLPTNVEFLVLAGSGDFDGTGNTLNNYLLGNSGANLLSGLDGDDELDGNAGADMLIGGAGRDLMTGGGGPDVFKWSTSPASGTSDFAGTTAQTADFIIDFNQGDGDLIDLTEVDATPQSAGLSTWNWIGSSAFQSGQAGQLRYEIAAGQTLVLGDYDGDTVADIAILLDGVVPLNQISPSVIG